MRRIRRFGRVAHLRPATREAYAAMHAAPPRELLEDLRTRNISNYSIFLAGDQLFAYFEYIGDDFEADMAGESDIGMRWSEQMRQLLEPAAGAAEGKWWTDMEEIFHLD